MKTTTFIIEGMSCEACANTIKSLVQKEPGVRMASVSFGERLARVLYDPWAVQEERLLDVIQDPGFRVVGYEAAGESARRKTIVLTPGSQRGMETAMSITAETAPNLGLWSEDARELGS